VRRACAQYVLTNKEERKDFALMKSLSQRVRAAHTAGRVADTRAAQSDFTVELTRDTGARLALAVAH
jgi:hypothetical protein